MAQEYAAAIEHNTEINGRRDQWRALAAIATLTSVFSVLVLVGLGVVTNLDGHG